MKKICCLILLNWFALMAINAQGFHCSTDTLLPPQNLDYVYEGYFDVHLFWDPPANDGWIHWDNEVNDGGIGLQNGGFFYVASRWTQEDLTPYNGFHFTKMKFFANTGYGSTFSIRIWKGDNAANLIYSQDIFSFTFFNWNEIVLDDPVLIDASEELWFGYVVMQSLLLVPAGVDPGPAIPYKGDMISYDGNEWFSLSVEYGHDQNWNLAGWVSSTKNENDVEISLPKQTEKNNFFTQVENTKIMTSQLLGYNIYRSDNGYDFDLISFIPGLVYDDVVPDTGNYMYYVTALYDNGESVPSNTVSVEVFIPTGIVQNTHQQVRIYPNPSDGKLIIKSKSQIYSIEIYHASGMYFQHEKLISPTYQTILFIDTPGIHILKINTADSTFSQRIIIH